MPKVSPSKQKMRIAHKFATELQKAMGDNLKAVFVYGSVAANMATPESDIDLFVVCHDDERTQRELIDFISALSSIRKESSHFCKKIFVLDS